MTAREPAAEATTSITAPLRFGAESVPHSASVQVNVADAVIVPNPGGIGAEAMAVELERDPANVVVTSVKLPICGVTRTFTGTATGISTR